MVVSGYIRMMIVENKYEIDGILSGDVIGVITIYYDKELLHCMDWTGYKTVHGLIGMGFVKNEKVTDEHRVIPLSYILT